MSQSAYSPIWRLVVVYCLILVVFTLIIWRAINLAVVDKAFLQSQGNARSLRDLSIPAYRGMLLDRHNSVLAVSTPVMDLWISPLTFNKTLQNLTELAKLLNVRHDMLTKKISMNQKKHFLYLKREITPSLAAKITALKIDGLRLKKEYKRFYPLANVLAPVVGFTDIDETGIEGLELAFNSALGGENGVRRVIKDRLGHIIDELGVMKKPRQGQNIALALDKRIQYVTYRRLKETVEAFDAKSGSMVVMDVNNGEILAMANYPSYNPNARVSHRDGRYRNRSVTDLFEPGSVIKAFSVASALDSDLFSPETLIDTTPSWMMVDGNTIHDDRENGVLSVTQVMKRSSNVGITKMVLSSPAVQLDGLLKRVGFGQLTGSGFPGESGGMLENKTQASPFVLATLGFGYGLSVTTLQLAQAYAVFANGGYLMPARFLLATQKTFSKKVIKSKIAQQVLNILEAVVEENGTGQRARVAGYRIAGKTGTSRIAGKNGYDKNRHIASFVGIAPVSQPKLVISVVIREPRKVSYYGGRVAAPLFSKVMGESLRILGVSPDKPLS